jgi:hypothetical protein
MGTAAHYKLGFQIKHAFLASVLIGPTQFKWTMMKVRMTVFALV